jgi:RNA polymerase sigma-70 factor (ECF subfamily)
MLSSARSREVQELLDQLEPEYRLAVVLRYWYDYSYAEIADEMGTTESAVKSRLFRARKMLADLVETADVDTADDDARTSRLEGFSRD